MAKKILKGNYLYVLKKSDFKMFFFTDLYLKELVEKKLIMENYIDPEYDNYKLKLLFHTSNVGDFKKI